MTEPGLIDDAVRFGAGGVGVGGGLAAAAVSLRWLINFVFGRIDQRQARADAQDAEIDEKWRAYREVLESRVGVLETRLKDLEAEVERCHAERRELLEHVAKYDGFSTGRGEAAELQQIGISAQRVNEGADGD